MEHRTTCPPTLEQVLPDEAGRLDVVFSDEGQQYWVDLAVTSAKTNSARHVQANAHTDGAAARAEEGVKAYRYRGRAYAFVLEVAGRPGVGVIAFMRRFVAQAGDGPA